MKKVITILLAAVLLTGCGSGVKQAEAEISTAESAASSVVERATPSQAPTEKPTTAPTATPADAEKETSAKPVTKEDSTVGATKTPTPTATPKPTTELLPIPTASPTQAPATQQPQEPSASVVGMSGGSLPLDLSAGSDQWWQIDSSDSAYWAVQDNINAIRAAGGLSALSMDSGLSSAAGARCENYVAGGAFDHSGMTTTSEICAQGGITSASAVCSAWQGSPDHYANIMRTDISSMGVACWWCTVDGNSFAYWVVTFG